MDPKRSTWEKLSLVLLGVIYAAWAGLFIYRSSYIGIDGQRYFGLFDDAMISMRYAWNFAHGLGLVWNAGQRVEGYSNLLMTLLMTLSALAFDRRTAVLAVQLAGIPTVLLTAYLAWRLSSGLNKDDTVAWRGILVYACVLLYYPLSYWTLMGMETGLLTLFTLACAFLGWRWLSTGRTADLLGMSAFAALAFLTRNDSILLAALVFAYVAFEHYRKHRQLRSLWPVLIASAIVVGAVVGQTVFRLAYYGTPLPNTFTLKLTGIPLLIRLIGGTRFVLQFMQQSWLILALAAVALIFEFTSFRALLASMMVVAMAYQIYAGGDPWPSWRLLAPAMPGVFILAVAAASWLLARWRSSAARLPTRIFASTLLVLAALGLADLPFLSDMTVRGPTSAAIANRVNTDSAIAIESLTQPGASIGVIWAGTLPYYADRPAVDFLGKSDAHIARLPADISGAVSWGGMISVPGHNKYDLDYSIIQLQPTYVQSFSWGYDTVKPYVMQNYSRVEYHGALGTKTVFLRKDSPLVCWDACRAEYKIIPWPGQR
jgi:arabinofuranosyltransferase